MPQTTSSYIPSQILVLLSISFLAANVGRASTPAAGLQDPPASEARRPQAALGWPGPPRLQPPPPGTPRSLAAFATNAGGSPSRRAPTTYGALRPVTSSTLRIISSTECPPPVPTLN